jgi:hypothetical protein
MGKWVLIAIVAVLVIAGLVASWRFQKEGGTGLGPKR